jgi:hypothetical protein
MLILNFDNVHAETRFPFKTGILKGDLILRRGDEHKRVISNNLGSFSLNVGVIHDFVKRELNLYNEELLETVGEIARIDWETLNFEIENIPEFVFRRGYFDDEIEHYVSGYATVELDNYELLGVPGIFCLLDIKFSEKVVQKFK